MALCIMHYGLWITNYQLSITITNYMYGLTADYRIMDLDYRIMGTCLYQYQYQYQYLNINAAKPI